MRLTHDEFVLLVQMSVSLSLSTVLFIAAYHIWTSNSTK